MNFHTISLTEHVQFDRNKLLALVHYVCDRLAADELGRFKLHKVLYFSDMLHYAASGRPLTGVEYQKQPFGPCARHLNWALTELQKSGALEAVRRDYFGFPKDDFIVKRPPDPKDLTRYEREVIDEVIDFVRSKSARMLSELSHDEPWRSVQMGERIPYYTAFYLNPVEIDQTDREWAVKEARRIMAERLDDGG